MRTLCFGKKIFLFQKRRRCVSLRFLMLTIKFRFLKYCSHLTTQSLQYILYFYQECIEDCIVSRICLEDSQSKSQRCFLSTGSSIASFNILEGKCLSFRKNRHAREITTLTFFNPRKVITCLIVDTINYLTNRFYFTVVCSVIHLFQVEFRKIQMNFR